MHTLQAENFIVILRAAMGHGKRPLTAPDWELLTQWARLQSLPALFYAGASQYEEFQQWLFDCRKQDREMRVEVKHIVISD